MRAELGFLASDAMQGRGSATNYERLAAEYIGSMFRQFGLEPGGDTDASNTPGFVQRVQLETTRFVSAPNVTAGGKSWQYGKDFLITGIRTPRLSGELQIIDGAAAPAKGSIALIRLPENADLQQRQNRVRAARTAQAALLSYSKPTPTGDSGGGSARLPNVPARGRRARN